MLLKYGRKAVIIMEIFYNAQKKALIVGLKTELDHHSAKNVRQTVDLYFADTKAKHIIFDLSKLEFMDSSGIGLIMGRYKFISPVGGKIILSGVNKETDRIMKLSGIYKIAGCAENVCDALKLL